MQKTHVKKGDTVTVITGSHKGKEGKILQVFPRRQRALVEGVAMMKRHTKKSQNSPEGSIEEREAPIHISNLRKVEGATKEKD